MKKLCQFAGLAAAMAGLPGVARAAAPDPAGCPKLEVTEAGESRNTAPLKVPDALKDIAGASIDNLAVSTLAGERLCFDIREKDSLVDLAMTPDGRFLSFRWLGYETYGQYLIDRTGKGTVHEVGATPVFSPSRRRFAAVDLNELDYGTLKGIAIWRVGPGGIARIAAIENIPVMQDWRIDGWTGETCIALSAIPGGPNGAGAIDWARSPRVRYGMRLGNAGWRLARSARPCSRR